MQHNQRCAALLLSLVAVMMIAGCAIDPMEQLSRDIESQEVVVKTQAIQTMASLDDPRVIEKLLDVFEKDDQLCDLAAVALVKKGREIERNGRSVSNRIVEDVGRILANAHLAEPFRARAAWTLGEIGSRQAVPLLITGTTATVGVAPATLVRECSTQALEKLGYHSDGRSYEIPMGTLAGSVDILPQPEPLGSPDAA
jgi:HEAT repeat protein